MRTKPRNQEHLMLDDPKPTEPDAPATKDADAPAKKRKAKKMATRKTSKARAGKKRVAAKAAAKRDSNSGARNRLASDAKVTVLKKENPYSTTKGRDGRYQRAQIVLRNSGKTVEQIRKLIPDKLWRPNTLQNMAGLGLIRISGK
jgi:hypothetical protein